ncbi:cation:proton antiporter [Dermacoccus nishinomiyaensis]|uniref:cation:proton antiporter domain-containing protein n=1 Tax=Dermacoccus nishinomiyaensis TaxID=1274 RepID=UPI0013F3C847|nr:cation:proton antiporter [Dermacoccus nishinomiyaensis]MCG7429653.1 cation:proton antiporter [Dermacoccus nishinomiyaensis]NHC32417.1 hypothetical protein [Dermacoccus nishinomiyaensis]
MTRLIRAGKGPFKDNVSEDGVHVHHAVQGIFALLAGAVMNTAAESSVFRVLGAILIGAGASLILDEIVLALLLFLDATQVKKLRRRTTGLLVRLVLLGVSLCLFVATVVAGMMFPHERLVVCLIHACIIVPTDMAPAARVLGERRIPMRIRNLLNTESGHHDRVVAPSSSSRRSCSRPGTTTAASRRSRTWWRRRPTPSSSVSSSAP